MGDRVQAVPVSGAEIYRVIGVFLRCVAACDLEKVAADRPEPVGCRARSGLTLPAATAYRWSVGTSVDVSSVLRSPACGFGQRTSAPGVDDDCRASHAR